MASSSSLDLFVSHSSVDADLVGPVVDLLQYALGLEPERIRATSIDGYRLPAGIPFEEALRQETRDARAFIAVISPASLNSTYVAFELGARWGAKRHLVPLLTREVTASALEGPLTTLSAMRIDDRAQMQQLIDDLAAELNIRPRAAHQYGRQLERLLTAAAQRLESTLLNDFRPDADATEDFDIDYTSLVERLEGIFALRESILGFALWDNGRDRVLNKIVSLRDSVKDWIRANRLRADTEIIKDTEKLLAVFVSTPSNRTSDEEDVGRPHFDRLVKRVRSLVRSRPRRATMDPKQGS